MTNSSKAAVTALNQEYLNIKSWFPADNSSSIAWMEQRIRIGQWTIFSFDIVLWLVTIVALVLAFGKSQYKKKIVLSVSIIGTILLILISIAFLYYMWGIAALSGGCNVMKEIVNGNTKILEDINVSDEFKKQANKCFFTRDGNTYS